MGFMKHWMCENCYAIMTNLNENDDKCVCTYCKSVYDRKELEAKSKFLEFKNYFGKYELEMERVYDHYMLMQALTRIFHNITVLYNT
jgi:hypothetical protein